MSQPSRLPGKRALCPERKGAETERGKQSQVLGTRPPSSQPCCSGGRCAGRKHLCPAGEERVGSGLLGLRNKQAVPRSAAQAASPWSRCQQSALSPARPGQPHAPTLPARAPQQGQIKPAGPNLRGQSQQVLEQRPGRPRPRAWSERCPGCPGTAERGHEGRCQERTHAREQQ